VVRPAGGNDLLEREHFRGAAHSSTPVAELGNLNDGAVIIGGFNDHIDLAFAQLALEESQKP
jgi:hypothetical protein